MWTLVLLGTMEIQLYMNANHVLVVALLVQQLVSIAKAVQTDIILMVILVALVVQVVPLQISIQELAMLAFHIVVFVLEMQILALLVKMGII